MAGETKTLDKKVYDELCDQVRHVVTEARSLVNRIKKLEKLIDELGDCEVLEDG